MLSVKHMRCCALLAIVMVLTSASAPFGVSGQTTSKGLSKDGIIDLLKGGVPSTRVEALVRQDGIAFEMTHAISTQLRQAGASDSLMKALWQLSSARSSPAGTPAVGGTSQPPAPAGPPPILQIKVKPGGTQVYIDDELMGSTSSRGRLKLSQLTPGQHNVRLGHPGYSDYEQNVTLVAGQTAPITATLEMVKATKDQKDAQSIELGSPANVTGSTATQATPAAAVAGSSAALATSAASVRTIPSGTEIAVRTNEAIDSKTAAVGQRFSALIDQDILDSSGSVAIPKGSDAALVIRKATGGTVTTSSDLVLDIDSVTLAGSRYDVSTADLQETGRQGIGANKRTAEMLGGGAALGTLIGAIAGKGKGAGIGAAVGAAGGAAAQVLTKGKEVTVPAETILKFKLDKDLALTVTR